MLGCRISEPEPNNDNTNCDPDLDDALTAHVRTPKEKSDMHCKSETVTITTPTLDRWESTQVSLADTFKVFAGWLHQALVQHALHINILSPESVVSWLNDHISCYLHIGMQMGEYLNSESGGTPGRMKKQTSGQTITPEATSR